MDEETGFTMVSAFQSVFLTLANTKYSPKSASIGVSIALQILAFPFLIPSGFALRVSNIGSCNAFLDLHW